MLEVIQLRIACFIWKIHYFSMFYCLYFSVTTNEAKEKFRIVFRCFLGIKNIVAPSSSCNFPVNFICWGRLAFVCFLRVDKNGLLSINALKSLLFSNER